MFVGIDPSISNTGVVVLNDAGNIVHAVNGKDAYEGKKFFTDIEKYVCQTEYLAKFVPSNSIVAYENYSFGSVHRAYSLAEYGGILKAKLYNLNCDVTLVAPAVNKKFATGYGQASKESIIEQACTECTSLSKDTTDDICDAYFLAKFAFYKTHPEKVVMLDKGNAHLRTRLELVLKK